VHLLRQLSAAYIQSPGQYNFDESIKRLHLLATVAWEVFRVLNKS